MRETNSAVVAMVVALVLLSGLVIYQQRQLSHKPPVPSPCASLSAMDDDPVNCPAQAVPAVAAKPVVPAVSVSTPPVEKAAAPAKNASAFMDGLASMMKNPEMKEMMRAQQEGALEFTHGSLFRYLGLTGDALKDFKALLVDRQMAMLDTSLSAMESGTTREDRLKKAEELKKITDDYDQQIREFLGEKDFAVYKEFEDTQTERIEVNMFKQHLDPILSLTEQQEHDLIVALNEERKSFQFIEAMKEPGKIDPADINEAFMARMMEETAKLQDKSAVRAAAILNPQQLEQFREHQKQYYAMQAMGMKMASQLFNKKE
jgi:hypothetical protein